MPFLWGVFLIGATVFAAGIPGGGFVLAFVLVPVHWLVARDSRWPVLRWLWALVAGFAVGARRARDGRRRGHGRAGGPTGQAGSTSSTVAAPIPPPAQRDPTPIPP